MKAKQVFESILKPRGADDVLAAIQNLSVNEKISKIKEMQLKWGGMYQSLLQNEQIVNNIREGIKNELANMQIVEKVNYIEKLEKSLPDIFSGLRDDATVDELRKYIMQRPFEEKVTLLWRFYKSWPDLFKDAEHDSSVDDETNQLLLLFKIKGALDNDNMESLQAFIRKMGEQYGRKNVLEIAEKIYTERGTRLFNLREIEQLKLTLFKETRSEEESIRDEVYDVYAFIGYDDYKEKVIDGETYSKKRLGIENLVKIDKYSASSLQKIPMMKLRASQQGSDMHVWGVYIPKYMWNKDYAYNDEIPDDVRSHIDKNKFKV